MTVAVLLAVAAVLAAWLLFVHRGLARLSAAVAEAWSSVDVLLVQRHDELPRLVDLCRERMPEEQDSAERVLKARLAVFRAAGRRDVAALGAAESSLQAALARLLRAADSCPALLDAEEFRVLRTRTDQIGAALGDRRELYNSAVNLLNVRIRQLPHALVARLAGLREAPLLEFC